MAPPAVQAEARQRRLEQRNQGKVTAEQPEPPPAATAAAASPEARSKRGPSEGPGTWKRIRTDRPPADAATAGPGAVPVMNVFVSQTNVFLNPGDPSPIVTAAAVSRSYQAGQPVKKSSEVTPAAEDVVLLVDIDSE